MVTNVDRAANGMILEEYRGIPSHRQEHTDVLVRLEADDAARSLGQSNVN